MIYTEVEQATKAQTAKLREEQDNIPVRIEALRANIATEDSKRRDAEIRAEIKALTARRRQIWDDIYGIESCAFRKALAVEYGVVGNPKFDIAYDIAYDMGHSSGFSEIENYFSELVDLIK